jgi:hypothetical protein
MRLRAPGGKWRTADAFERAARRLARRGLCNSRVAPNRFCGKPAENEPTRVQSMLDERVSQLLYGEEVD